MNRLPCNKVGGDKRRPSLAAGMRASPILPAPPVFLLAAFCLLSFGFGVVTSLAAKEKPTATYTIALPSQPDFSRLDWMIGEWSGKTADRDPAGEVWLSVTYDLDKRIMIFREKTSLPAGKAIPAAIETWMGVLSAGQIDSEFILRVFSSTGFITRYRVSGDGAELQFNPDGGGHPPAGWLFRRILTRSSADELTETVHAAPPQKPFFVYYTAKLTRSKPAGSKPG